MINNSKKIEMIASKHLGKSATNIENPVYCTSNKIDNSLLVGIPRILNRQNHDINCHKLNFVGFDVWHSFEFSCLLKNNYPVSGMLKLKYPLNSENIVESKSFKLYLNSFNLVKISNSIVDSKKIIESIIKKDLKEILVCKNKADIHVNLFLDVVEKCPNRISPFKKFNIINLEKSLDIENLDFNYDKNNVIKTINQANNQNDILYSNALRSNCRVTNQPDWGDVYIYYKSDFTIDKHSILQYIISLRNENHFHEEICECIYNLLFNKLNPEELLVACFYTRRGGIDINPIRANNQKTLEIVNDYLNVNNISFRSFRQ